MKIDMDEHTLLRAEIRAVKKQIQQMGRRQQHLARTFLTYMNEAHLDRPERVRNARALAEFVHTIVGGAQGGPPTCVAVGRTDTAGFYGSGVLVLDSRLVLTAAHCGPPFSTLPTAVNLGVEAVTQPPVGELRKATFRAFPGYRDGGPHDLAAMVLSEKSEIPPADLATHDDLSRADEVILAGFGDDDLAGTLGAGIKRFVKVPIVFMQGGISDTPDNPHRNDTFDHQMEFLAGRPGSGACFGDSGGPAYVEVDGKLKVAGITARVRSSICNGVSVLTRLDVQAHRAFILQHVPTS
jgi:secreted trypsin-like serine protease